MSKRPVENIETLIGARIRARRLQLGLSQEKLGAALNLTFQQVQKYEKGTNRVSVSRMIDIARILETTVQFFIEGIERKPSGAVNGNETIPSFLLTNDGITLVDTLLLMPPGKRKQTLRAVRDLVAATR